MYGTPTCWLCFLNAEKAQNVFVIDLETDAIVQKGQKRISWDRKQ
jgi:uncharacterized radical SAM superfamily Fe-S cluster-containing enzyme